MLGLGVLGAAVGEHLRLVELVDADDAAGVLAGGPGLAPVAGGPAHVALGPGGQVEDLVGVVAGQGHLGGAGEVEVVGGQVVDLVAVGAQEAGAAHDLRGDEGGGGHRGEAVGDGGVQGRRHEGQLQAHAPALEVVEAGPGDLGAAAGVDDVQALADRQVVGGLEALGSEVAGPAALVAQDDVVLLAARGRPLDEVGELAGQVVELDGGGRGGGLGGLDLLGQLLGVGQDRGALLRGGLPHGPGDLLLLGAEVLEGGQRLTAGLVGGDDAVDEIDVGTTGSLAGAEGLGVLTKRTQVDHGPECSQDRGPHRIPAAPRADPGRERGGRRGPGEPGTTKVTGEWLSQHSGAQRTGIDVIAPAPTPPSGRPEGLETLESSGRLDGRGASPARPRPIHARPHPHYRPMANVTHFPLTNAIHL